MNGKKIFVDFDGTLCNSIEAIVSIYDEDFCMYKYYKKIHWTEVNTWGFEELTLVNKKMVLNYFDDFRFFQRVNFMENAKSALERLSKTHEIIVCSMGTKTNQKYKEAWLKQNLSFAKFIGVDLNEGNKKAIDMTDSYLIDDVSENLLTSNCAHPFIYGDKYPWNVGTKIHRCYNWLEFEKEVERLEYLEK